MGDNAMKDPCITPAYVAFYPILTEICREHGYSLSIHGSVMNDMDLIAIPWIEDAKEVQALVDAIACYATQVMSLMFRNPASVQGPESKPHGRLAWSIQIANGYSIDLSIIPPSR